MSINSKNIVVLYHADCPDGFGAAYVAWKKFADRAEYIPMFHHAPVPEMSGKELYLLDISYDAQTLKQLSDTNTVMVIDHHVSREQETKSVKHLYATDNSGTGLAWQHFFQSEPLPEILKYIEEEDIWKFKSPNIKEILMVFHLIPHDFKVWDVEIKRFEEQPEVKQQYIVEGAAMLRYKEWLIKRIMKNINPIEFEGYKTFAVNSSVFASEIGHIISAELAPPIGVVWAHRGGRIAVSLRSDGSVNVGDLAAKYGGGGHTAAAAFTLPLDGTLPWKYQKDSQ